MGLIRWWHSKGFGIQSPWAYKLVTEVLSNRKDLQSRLQDALIGYEWILVEDINGKNRTQWQSIVNDPRATATFDMKKSGLAVYDPKRYKQHYTI